LPNVKPLSALAFIPSVYGFCTWTAALLLYQTRLMEWFPSSGNSLYVFSAVAACFAISAAVNLPAFTRTVQANTREALHLAAAGRSRLNVNDATLWICHVLGIIGLALYLSEILQIFGGIQGLLDVLVSESHLVRGAEIDLIGVYFSYFGWIAIPLTALRWQNAGRPPLLLTLVAVVQICGNLLFIDRTRPVWIGFVTLLILLPGNTSLSAHRILARVGLIVVGALGAFYGIAFWIGKTGEVFPYYGPVHVSTETGILYYYITCGFAYFEAIWNEILIPTMTPERTLYPLFKVLSMLSIAPTPPAQILPFMDLPFPTNTGTFLEPLYSDGGIAYLAFGVIAATLGVDRLALWCLRSRQPMVVVFWANLCFASFIAFFVPKLAGTPLWMFGTFAAVSAILEFSLKPSMAAGQEHGPPHPGRPEHPKEVALRAGLE
jgi:hypothetical protein